MMERQIKSMSSSEGLANASTFALSGVECSQKPLYESQFELVFCPPLLNHEFLSGQDGFWFCVIEHCVHVTAASSRLLLHCEIRY